MQHGLPTAARAVCDAVVTQWLIVLWAANCKVYGTLKSWNGARRPGSHVGHGQVPRLEDHEDRTHHLSTAFSKTRLAPGAARAPHLKNSNLRADRPEALLVIDLTEMPTRTGTAYGCFIVDAPSTGINDLHAAESMKPDMVTDVHGMVRRPYANHPLIRIVTHPDAGS